LEANVPEKLTLPSFPTPLKPRYRAIIVGASGGIGAAVSRRLAQEGYTLALVDLNEKALKGLCNEINQKSGETRASYYVITLLSMILFQMRCAALSRTLAD